MQCIERVWNGIKPVPTPSSSSAVKRTHTETKNCFLLNSLKRSFQNRHVPLAYPESVSTAIGFEADELAAKGTFAYSSTSRPGYAIASPMSVSDDAHDDGRGQDETPAFAAIASGTATNIHEQN